MGRFLRARSQGFSLVQLSIMLAVGGLVLAAVIPGEEAGSYPRKAENTVRKMERIDEAMKAFMAAKGRRPCPADGSLAVGNASFGAENGSAGTCTGNFGASGNAIAGIVPVKAIGLQDGDAFDEFGRRITYVVDKRGTAVGGGNGVTTWGITVKDSAGATLDTVSYLYVSHGADGHGAFPAQGSAVAGRINTGSTDADTLDNASVDSSFATSFNAAFVKKAKTSAFDDVVYYNNYYKNLSSLGEGHVAASAGFRVDGEAGDVLVNRSMATGDVNGDGIADMILGAYYNNSAAGSVYVVFGTSSGFPNPLLVSTLNGANGFRVDSAVSNEYAGLFVGSGDLNGDGKADILVGAPAFAGGARGKVYVLFGGATRKDGVAWSSSLTLNGTLLNGTNGFTVNAGVNTWFMGSAVTAGDVNGDGYDDLLMGAYGSNTSNTGAVYGMFGKASGWSSTYSVTTGGGAPIDGTNGFEINGSGTQDFTGMAVASGDFNGDGYDDIVIDSPRSFNGTTGEIDVVFGHRGTWPTAFSIANLDGTAGVRFKEANINDFCGVNIANGGDNPGDSSMLTMGDVNGDGKADIIAGAPCYNSKAGAVYVVFGSSVWSPSQLIDDVGAGYSATSGWGNAACGWGGNLQYSAAGSGRSATWTFSVTPGSYTVRVSNTCNDPANRATNAPFTVYDNASPLGTVTVDQRYAGAVSYLGTTWTTLGTYTISSNTLKVTLTDSANGLVTADAVVVVPNITQLVDDGGAGYSATSGWSNFACGWGGNIQHSAAGSGRSATWTFSAPVGVYDVVATNACNDPNNRASNAPYTLYDNATAQATVTVDQRYAGSISAAGTTWTMLGSQRASSGTLKATLTDSANGLVIADAIAITPTTSIKLDTTFLNGINGFQLNGAAAGYLAGYGVAAGDVNNDGYDDVIIGAPQHNYGSYIGLGAAYVVFGKASGWSSSATTLNATFLNGTNGAQFTGVTAGAGSAVGAADVDGDGISDALLGECCADHQGAFSGSVYVYLGVVSGWPTAAYDLDDL